MDFFLLVGTLSLILQFGVFMVLLGGYGLKKMGRFREHGFFMFLGAILHLIVIGVIMVPSFAEALIPVVDVPLLSLTGLIVPVHAVLGGVTAGLAIWILARWRFRRSLEYCAVRKRFMRLTFWLWLASLALGFLLYLSLFWNQL